LEAREVGVNVGIKCLSEVRRVGGYTGIKHMWRQDELAEIPA
jgi:hypothetical protein